MLRVRARGRPGPRSRPLQRARHLLIPLLAGVAVAAASTAAAQPTTAADSISTVGVRASLDDLILRARLREAGWLVAVGENANVPGPLVLGTGSGRLLHDPVPELVPPLGSAPLLSPAVARVAITAAPQVHYSPELAAVFVLGGPGYFPTPPDYYFADGVYPVYDPPAFDDPSIYVLAAPRAAYEAAAEAENRYQLLRRLRRTGRTGEEAQAGAGITVTVPITMPGPLAEVFGRGATSLRVTGRENLSFGGESRRIKPELKGELGRGQSLFPTLDMKQELQVKLEGTIGDKVHVQVDHNSTGFGNDANRINIYYQGYDDDIVQRVDLGGTNLALPGASLVAFSGGRSGLFGIKSEMRLGNLKLNMVASKEEAEVSSRTLSSQGGSPRPVSFFDKSFLNDKFFFYERPDTNYTIFYDTYGIDPALLLDESLANQFHVFVDTQASNSADRPFIGFAVADLPAGGDTVAMRQAWEQAPTTARYPKDGPDGRWKELVQGDDYGLVLHTLGNGSKAILGFYLRYGSAGASDALGITIDSPQDSVGATIVRPNAVPELRLRLIRHPEQDTDFDAHPSAMYMMRHVYSLSANEIQSLELAVVLDQSAQNADIPPLVPGSTYLHMFGLDDYDEATGRPGPDGRVDLSRANLVDLREGFLYMSGLRPFSPPREVIIQRLLSVAGIDTAAVLADPDQFFPPTERLDSSLYTLPSTEQEKPHRYRIEGQTSGTDTDIFLDQEIIEGSEVVKIDGKTLVRGTDYDIENFAGGRITLKGEALTLLNPTSRIEVTYQYLPLVGGGNSTLLGVSGEYELGGRGRFGSVFLYESTGSTTQRVKFGEEPTRSMVADVNGTLRFEPSWMTRLINLLPFTNATTTSQINVTAEVAASFPNPNTRNTAFVDDMEGADESDEQAMARSAWSFASIPVPVSEAAGEDPALRVPVAFYNPPGEVRRGHLNPTLSENEVNDGVTVLELGFDQDSLATLLQPTNPRSQYLWSGIMRSFGAAGLDLTRTKSIEMWLNDYQSDPATRRGKMHIDFGEISEDFIHFPNPADGSRFNREAPTAQDWNAVDDDTGWNGVFDGCDRDYPSGDCPNRALVVPFGSDCYAAEVTNCDGNRGGQHYLANGTELNNQYDTEDLNNNGRFDDINSYFGITIDLADTAYVLTDVSPTYAGQGYTDLEPYFYGWRKYRIDLDRVVQDVLHDPGASMPNLRKISYIRIWFEDDPGTPPEQSVFRTDLQIYGLRLTRNQWVDLGFFAVDGPEVPPEPGSKFSLGTINNKDDSAIYWIPPDAEEIDDQGAQAREQSLRINVEDLEPGREVVAERQLTSLGRGLDFTTYNRMSFWVKANPSTRDTLEFFFRCGTDTLNYYEIANTVLPTADWQRVTVDLTQLTGLKFPEDYPGSTVKYVEFGGQRVLQTSAPTVDARFAHVPLRVTLRGQPSFTAITRFACGVRNPAGGFPTRGGQPAGTPRPAAFRPPASGEVWFNNVRLEEPERETGVAQAYSGGVKFSDVIDVSANYAANNAEFQTLQQRTAINQDRYRFQGNVRSELSRLVPTAGFSIPVNYGYSRDRTLPKFFTQSDTRNTDERKQEQRSEGEQTGYGFSITKRPSRAWIAKVALDPLSFTYNKSFDKRFSYTSRDTSESRARNLKYSLSPRERPVTLWKNVRLNLLPTSVSFQAQEQRSEATRFSVLHPRSGTTSRDSLVRQPTSVTQSLNLNASTALRPLQMMNVRYSFNENRDYRTAHPVNQAERFSVLGYDFGLPKGRSEGLGIDVTPRRFRFNYSTQFSDQRTFLRTQTGDPLPDVHSASTNRTARLQFDFGLHRRLMGWVLPGKDASKAAARRPGEPEPRPVEAPPRPVEGPGDEPPPEPGDEPPGQGKPPDEGPGGGGAFSPFPSIQVPPDTTTAPPPSPPPTVPPPGPGTTPPGTPPPGAAPPSAPPPGAAPGSTQPAEPDSAARPGRKFPNPVTGLLRKVGDIEAVKVEYSNSKTAAYTGLSDTPSGAFRYGFSTDSGLDGPQYETPSREDDRQTLDLQTGLPIRGKLRLGIRYKLDTALGKRRNYETDRPDVLRGLNEDHTTDVTFPSLDLAINNVERIGFFGNKLERSNITLGFSRTTNERFSTTQVPGGPKVEGTGRSETSRDNLTANWTGQWKRGVSTSLALTRTGNSQVTTGPIRSEGTTYQVQGTVRFKVAPKGGLQLPFLGSRGRLKSGIDITLNGSYNRDSRVRFNDPSRPDYFVPESQSSAINVGARGDYTLSRNMTGGIDLGYTRNKNDIANQTVTTIRLGFNINFLF